MELLRFVLVGGSAVATDFTVYFLLVYLAPELPPSAAKATSFIAGAVVSFVFNRSFVFRSEGAAHRQAPLFAGLYLLTLGLNTGVNSALLARVPSTVPAPKLVAWFLATAASTIANFLGMKFVVFRKKEATA
jgi:putative flippase GtrA